MYMFTLHVQRKATWSGCLQARVARASVSDSIIAVLYFHSSESRDECSSRDKKQSFQLAFSSSCDSLPVLEISNLSSRTTLRTTSTGRSVEINRSLCHLDRLQRLSRERFLSIVASPACFQKALDARCKYANLSCSLAPRRRRRRRRRRKRRRRSPHVHCTTEGLHPPNSCRPETSEQLLQLSKFDGLISSLTCTVGTEHQHRPSWNSTVFHLVIELQKKVHLISTWERLRSNGLRQNVMGRP